MSARRPVFRLLAEQLEKAKRGEAHAVTVVNADPYYSKEEIATTAGEEAFRRGVLRATDGAGSTEAEARTIIHLNTPVHKKPLESC